VVIEEIYAQCMEIKGLFLESIEPETRFVWMKVERGVFNGFHKQLQLFEKKVKENVYEEIHRVNDERAQQWKDLITSQILEVQKRNELALSKVQEQIHLEALENEEKFLTALKDSQETARRLNEQSQLNYHHPKTTAPPPPPPPPPSSPPLSLPSPSHITTLKFNHSSLYTGTLKNSKMHGKGTYTWANGDTYEGQFSNGVIEGKGTIFNRENGSRYTGDWLGGKMDGFGVFRWASGLVYEGGMRKGCCDGEGMLEWGDGERWAGKFKGNERCGKGVVYGRDGGEVERGVWIGDKKYQIKKKG
jgi:hypothetical protein